jgi:hypothetical protein
MTERRLVEVGTFPTVDGEIFVVGDDVVRALLREADRKVEVEREEAAQRQKTAIAGAERMKATRRAMVARRLRKVLRLCRR